jgi:Rrf2 family protein
MRSDSRLSRALHVLLHMARFDGPATSEQLSEMFRMNPVVIRRTLAGLREAGYVRSEKGHGGGWTLNRDLSEITMLDIYTALGDPTIFAIGVASDHPGCLVEKAVNRAMDDAFQQAEALLIARLGQVTLADLARDFDAGFQNPQCDIALAGGTATGNEQPGVPTTG